MSRDANAIALLSQDTAGGEVREGPQPKVDRVPRRRFRIAAATVSAAMQE
jgi:hypothetical protein